MQVEILFVGDCVGRRKRIVKSMQRLAIIFHHFLTLIMRVFFIDILEIKEKAFVTYESVFFYALARML